MNSDNTAYQTNSVKQRSTNDVHYLSVPSLCTKQIINFKAQSTYQSAELLEEEDEGEYEL